MGANLNMWLGSLPKAETPGSVATLLPGIARVNDMKLVNVSELKGAALDWAVANAVEAWKTAHELFPTWTLDASFSGVRPMIYSDGQAFCQLIPNNPMRQDAQRYSPSADWSQGGPLIDREKVALLNETPMSGWLGICMNAGWHGGDTALIAACRAIVAAKLGSTVDVPEELL